jgi:hypothetical protein
MYFYHFYVLFSFFDELLSIAQIHCIDSLQIFPVHPQRNFTKNPFEMDMQESSGPFISPTELAITDE